MSMRFTAIGYVNGDAEILIHKRAMIENPEFRFKISGGTFRFFSIPYYSRNVFMTIKSEEDIGGFIYFSAYYRSVKTPPEIEAKIKARESAKSSIPE